LNQKHTYPAGEKSECAGKGYGQATSDGSDAKEKVVDQKYPSAAEPVDPEFFDVAHLCRCFRLMTHF